MRLRKINYCVSPLFASLSLVFDHAYQIYQRRRRCKRRDGDACHHRGSGAWIPVRRTIIEFSVIKRPFVLFSGVSVPFSVGCQNHTVHNSRWMVPVDLCSPRLTRYSSSHLPNTINTPTFHLQSSHSPILVLFLFDANISLVKSPSISV